MSNYYLCDTCGVGHYFDMSAGRWVCPRICHLPERRVIFDKQAPRSVCPHWKQKEKE